MKRKYTIKQELKIFNVDFNLMVELLLQANVNWNLYLKSNVALSMMRAPIHVFSVFQLYAVIFHSNR